MKNEDQRIETNSRLEPIIERQKLAGILKYRCGIRALLSLTTPQTNQPHYCLWKAAVSCMQLVKSVPRTATYFQDESLLQEKNRANDLTILVERNMYGGDS